IVTTGALAIALVLGSVSTFPAIDRWQDLAAMARAIHHDSDGKSLALLHPDETTVAMLDDSQHAAPISIPAKGTLAADAISSWFCEHPADGRVLVLLPGHAPGEVSRFLARWAREKQPGDGEAALLERGGVARLLQRYELPHGRRYGVMGPTSLACDHETL